MTSCRGPAPAMTRLVSDHRLLVWQAASLGVPGKDGLDGGRELGTSPEARGRLGIGSNTAHAGKMLRPGRWRQEQGCGETTCRPA